MLKIKKFLSLSPPYLSLSLSYKTMGRGPKKELDENVRLRNFSSHLTIVLCPVISSGLTEIFQYLTSYNENNLLAESQMSALSTYTLQTTESLN